MTALPGIEDCRISDGVDEARTFMELHYKDLVIREYLPSGYADMSDSVQKDAMKMCVYRCRMRLEAALRHKKTKVLNKKLKRIK